MLTQTSSNNNSLTSLHRRVVVIVVLATLFILTSVTAFVVWAAVLSDESPANWTKTHCPANAPAMAALTGTEPIEWKKLPSNVTNVPAWSFDAYTPYNKAVSLTIPYGIYEEGYHASSPILADGVNSGSATSLIGTWYCLKTR